LDIFLGIDFGTSGCRAIAIDESAKTIAMCSVPLPPPLRNGSHSEQDPQLWWQALIKVLTDLGKQITLQDIKAISIDGTSSTLVITDNMGKPLYPGILYNDTRSTKEVDLLKNIVPEDSPVLAASSSLAKLLWLHHQGYTKHMAHITHQADWIASNITGLYGVSDVNNCIKLGFDAVENCWPQWISKLPIATNLFPTTVTPGTITGKIFNSSLLALGFKKDTAVVAGTTDSTAAVLASGIKDIGDAVTSLGTTLVIKVLCEKPISSAKYGVYSQPYFDRWLVGGASNTGGAVLRHFFSDVQISALSKQLQPNKPTGLNYYPLVNNGERFPINDPDCEPVVSPRPKQDYLFFQGLLEGISTIEKRAYDCLHSLGAPYPRKVYTNGGGAINQAWGTIRSNMLNVPILNAINTNAAYGSALLAKKTIR